MARLSIEDLTKAPKRYRPSRTSRDFESKRAAVEEDRLRGRRIQVLLKRLDRLGTPLSKESLKQLRTSIGAACTPASSVYMRKQRDRLIGHVWAAVADKIENACTFTLVPRSWEVFGGRLDKVDPRALLQQLRSCLNRAGFEGQGGWLICLIHGEHEPTDDIFVIHVHGVAVGSARAAIDRLRKRRDFQGAPTKGKERVARRVRMSRQTLTGLPEPFTYIAQSFWPERVAFENVDGKDKRQRDKRRIEEPRHTEVLLWLDRWRLRDTCLLMGIQVTRGGLRATNRTYTNGGRP